MQPTGLGRDPRGSVNCIAKSAGRQGRVGHDPGGRQLLLHRGGRGEGPRDLRGYPEVRRLHHVRAHRRGHNQACGVGLGYSC